MRKTVSISISGMLFHVEEQAYKKLEQYLASIRQHFSTYEDDGEIIADIENRIAEHFTEKVTKSKKVISEADVDDLMTHMGTVKDFAAFEGEKNEHSSHEDAPFTTAKRLYRDPDNTMIAGVAAGIANYFGIDPTIIRLLFLVTLIPGGTGILIYIILWIVMPEAKTTSEKVEMRGHRLTLKRIEAAVREKVPAAAEKIKPGTFTRVIQFPFSLLRQLLSFMGKIVNFIVPLILRLVGCAILVGIVAALLFLTFAFIMLLVNAWEAYMDIPLRELAGNAVYYTALICGYLALLLPGILLLLLGTSMVLMRNQFRSPVVISLVGIWVAALLVGSVTVARDMPALHDAINQYIETHDTAVTKELDVPVFNAIEAHHGYELRVVRGTGSSVRVSGSKIMVEELTARVENETLIIQRTNSGARFCVICLSHNAAIDITVPDTLGNIAAYAGASVEMTGVDSTAENIIAHGGARVIIRGAQLADALNVNATGGSRIHIETPDSVSQLAIEGKSGSRIVYSGNARETVIHQLAGTTVELSGSGSQLQAKVTAGSSLRAVEFSVQDANVEVASGGRAEVNVGGTLKGEAYSGGAVYYTGNPRVIEFEEHPSGHVKALETSPSAWE